MEPAQNTHHTLKYSLFFDLWNALRCVSNEFFFSDSSECFFAIADTADAAAVADASSSFASYKDVCCVILFFALLPFVYGYWNLIYWFILKMVVWMCQMERKETRKPQFQNISKIKTTFQYTLRVSVSIRSNENCTKNASKTKFTLTTHL